MDSSMALYLPGLSTLNAPPMPDQKLKDAAQEIHEILNKYDIAGIVYLSSQTHLEYLYHLSPSWSCALIEEGEHGISGIRFRNLRKDFPTAEAQKECAEDTIGTLLGFKKLAEDTQLHMEQIGLKLGQFYDIISATKDE